MEKSANIITAFLTLLGVKQSYVRSEEHTSELQSQSNLVCRLLLEKKKESCIFDADSRQNLIYFHTQCATLAAFISAHTSYYCIPSTLTKCDGLPDTTLPYTYPCAS